MRVTQEDEVEFPIPCQGIHRPRLERGRARLLTGAPLIPAVLGIGDAAGNPISEPDRQHELVEASRKRGWEAELLTNGHVKVDHRSDQLNPLLGLLDELKLPPLEIIPAANVLEEMFVRALGSADAVG